MKRPALLITAPITTLCACLLSGCLATSPTVDVVLPTQVRPAPLVVPPMANNGSLFQAATYRPLYETPRARMVGDIVTVSITEKLTAKQESTNTIEKKGSLDTSVSAFPFSTADNLAKLSAKGSADNKLDGKGSTASNNTFTGSITATVVEVLTNGHLIISGEKQLGVNHNVEVLRFSGQVDPLSIQPGNTVASTSVANVRLEQRGRGAQDAAVEIGWLGRFFLSVSPL
jgi:flagellar L-ring protein precursor FlgH